MRHVIIGAGIAGTTAAEEIRKQDKETEIVLIGEEEHALYSRVLLPHYVVGKVPRERCFLKKETWYDEQRIEYLTGERVREIDTKNKHVVLQISGRELPYDKLLLATGGEPRLLGWDLRGMSYLQTLDDADHLLQIIGEQRGKSAQGVVCGGGFIACEYLNIFNAYHIPATCFYRGAWFWSQVLDEASGRFVHRHLEREGVTLLPETTLVNVAEQDGALQVETTSGVLPANIFGVGIGLERDLSWIEQVGVRVSQGICTNEYLETNVPDVYAVGDAVVFFDRVIEREHLVGNWMNAQMQARVVGKTMTGERTMFRLVSSYATDVLGIDVIFVGDTRRALADEIVVRESEGYIVQLFLAGHALVGATLVGKNTDRMSAVKLIESRRDLSEFHKDLADPSIPLSVFT